MGVKPKMTLLPCGHFSDDSDRCPICAERDAVAKMQQAASRPDPTRAQTATASEAGAGAGWATAEPIRDKILGEQPTAGVYDIPDSLYFRDPLRAYRTESLSGSSARFLIPPSTPAHYRWIADHRNEPTDAMIFGSAVHALTLDSADLAVFEGRSWRSKAGADFLREHDPDGDVAPILEHDVRRAKAMAHALRTHPLVAKMLRGAQVEQALFVEDDETGAWLRGKLDLLQPGASGHLIVGDIKTKDGHAHVSEFARAAAKLSYHVSDAHYARILRRLGLAKRVTMLYATVESRPPHLVAVHQISDEDVQRADELDRLAIGRFAHCLAAEEWPGYPPVINKATLPVYAARNDEEALYDGADEGENQ